MTLSTNLDELPSRLEILGKGVLSVKINEINRTIEFPQESSQ